MADDVLIRAQDARPVSGHAELSEADFYGLYSWCLNPILSVAELFTRLREELERHHPLGVKWQREECRINVYLFVCAIACTVDDYLAWRPWNLRRLVALRPRLGSLIAGAESMLNTPYALTHLRSHHRLRGWRWQWERCVAAACDFLISDTEPEVGQWTACRVAAQELMAVALPPDLMTRRMRVPEAFRCQDMAHQDVLTLAQRFAASGVGPRQSVVILGARTAGAYFAPLVGAYLGNRGWPRVSCLTVRPKSGLSRRECRQLRALGRGDAHVVVVDDYPATGSTIGLLLAALRRVGVDSARITLLVPRHWARIGWTPDWSDRIKQVVLEPDELHKLSRMEPASAESLLGSYCQDEGPARLQASPEVDAIKYLDGRGSPIAVIGDSDDDLEALELADQSYAPANCAPSVRELAKRGRCQVMREPRQRGLLAAACAAVGSGSRDLGEPALSPPPGGASELLLNLLAAAERPWLRQWLAVAAWWKL